MEWKYHFMVLYHKLLRDGCVVIPKGFRISIDINEVCMYCSKPLWETTLYPMINSKKEISFSCGKCMESVNKELVVKTMEDKQLVMKSCSACGFSNNVPLQMKCAYCGILLTL